MRIVRKATGFDGGVVNVKYTFTSTNSKTGNTIQQWITPESWERNNRADKVDVKDSSEVCKDCPLMDTCYVKKGHALMGLKSSAKSKNYTVGCEKDNIGKFTDEFVRFGAFGEPVLAGEKATKQIAQVASSWTGYTHQWRDLKYHWANQYFMASVEDVKGKREANALGYRTFRVADSLDEILSDEVLCPASKEAGRKVTCKDCKLCKGGSSKAKNIFIIKH
jgi:hypothetical protein